MEVQTVNLEMCILHVIHPTSCRLVGVYEDEVEYVQDFYKMVQLFGVKPS